MESFSVGFIASPSLFLWMSSGKLLNQNLVLPKMMAYLCYGMVCSSPPIAQYFALRFGTLWSRLAEIGVRTTFIVLILTASLLFKELDNRVNKLAKKSISQQQEMPMELNDWRSNYDLACQLVELIDGSFSFILIVITSIDYLSFVFEFNNGLTELSDNSYFFDAFGLMNDSNAAATDWKISFLKLLHPAARLLVITAVGYLKTLEQRC